MNKKTLKNEILKCKQQMRELQPYVNSNASMAVAYNRVIVKKAILVDKLKKLSSPAPIFKKIGSMLNFTGEKKLICDYFPPI